MVEAWMLGVAANAVIMLVYAGISYVMLDGLWRGRQWRSNPLAVATAAIFVTCTIGHGVHGLHGLLDTHGARAWMGSPVLVGWDLLTAGVAAWYFTIRRRLQLMFNGAALCEDLGRRQGEAQQLHDDVVQGLVAAKLALDLGRRDEGLRTVHDTLGAAKGLIARLLDPATDKGGATRAPTVRRLRHA